MQVVTLLFLLQYVMSWSLDYVCDADDIECQNPQISNPGEIIYVHIIVTQRFVDY